jgi:membrane associated rhomboid family serine protease
VIPLKLDTPVFRMPIVTWLLIAVNVLVFLWMKQRGPEGFQRAIFEYAAIPQSILGDDVVILTYEGEPFAAVQADGEVRGYVPGFDPRRLRVPRQSRFRYAYIDDLGFPIPLEPVPQKIPAWLTLLTAMFMHAGWLHIVFNLWTLNVFGTSVEDSLGRLAYLAFYLLCGFGASAAQLAHDPQSIIPSLGASGAISGVMGAFAVRFPGAQVLTLVPIILYTIAHLPAWLFMLVYLGEQVFMSLVDTAGNGGVAWWAHIGGFAAGYVLSRFFPVTSSWKEVFRRQQERRYS